MGATMDQLESCITLDGDEEKVLPITPNHEEYNQKVRQGQKFRFDKQRGDSEPNAIAQ